jgi:tetratricopeptide repeat protein/TIR domain-containing protein/NB-ARC domain-containing protein
MPAPVFLSYSRSTSQKHARDLKHALGEIAFLDTSVIPYGAQFPQILSDAVKGAKIIVIFADSEYFQRWFCLQELRLALNAFEDAVRRSGTDQERRDALASIVIALPDEGVPQELNLLPPILRIVNWPKASDLKNLVELIQARLNASEPVYGPPALTMGVDLVEESLLPALNDLRDVPTYPKQLGKSVRGSFVGRADELWLIHFIFTVLRFLYGRDTPIAVVLEGFGGVGKSQLAIEYVNRHGGFFRGGIFWVDARKRPGVEELASVSQKVIDRSSNLAEKLLREVRKDIEKTLQDAISQTAGGKPILIVIDGIPDTGPQSVEQWCPASTQVNLLITSRQRLSLADRVKLYSITIHPLQSDPSVRLLSSDLPKEIATVDDWQTIADWVGRLPLALRILNSTLADKATTASELVIKAKANQGPAGVVDEIADAIRSEIPHEVLPGLTEALSYSFDLLPKRAMEGALRLACLSPAPIPLRLAERLADRTARAVLVHRSFVVPSWQHDVEMYGSIHAVLADVVRNRNVSGRLRTWVFGHKASLTNQKRSRVREVVDVFMTLMLPDAWRNHDLWPMLNACIPHIDWLLDQNVMRSKLIELSEIEPLLIRVGRYLEQLEEKQGNLASVDDVYRNLEKNHPNWVRDGWLIAKYLDLLFTPPPPKDLASVRLQPYFLHNILGKSPLHPEEVLPVLPRMEKTLRARLRFLGACDPGTLTVWSDIGFSLLCLKRFDEAKEHLRQLISSCEGTLGARHPIITVAAWNLSNAYYFTRDYRSARRIMTKYLRWIQSAAPGQLVDVQREIQVFLGAMDDLIKSELSPH